jgi:DNA-binding NarL/FixJ family response regulator
MHVKSNNSNTKKTRTRLRKSVFIVEDHPVFREGLAQIINGEPDLIVSGKAGSAEEALAAIPRLKPDVVLVDITLPGKNGLELVKELRLRDGEVKLLVVSMHDEALYADRVLRAGGNGYIMKQEDPEEIVHAIRDVLGGHIYVSEQVFANPANGSAKRVAKPKTRPLEQLSDLELEVLEMIGQGKTKQELARQLSVTPKQVTSNCNQIRKKLKLQSSDALIRYAVCWVETGGT